MPLSTTQAPISKGNCKTADAAKISGRILPRAGLISKPLMSLAALIAGPLLLIWFAAESRAQSSKANQGPGIADTWQGTLHAGKDLRIVVRISRADDGGYKAVFYFVDRSGDGQPVSKTTLNGSTIKMELPLGDNFQLKWTPDESQFAQFRGTGAVVPPPTDDPNATPSLYTAMQEQLGLKMGPAKSLVHVIVIDHAEKPSEN